MVSQEQFVATYMRENGAVDNICRELGVGPATVKQRIKKMRQAGVRLPVKRTSANRYDVKALNNIIREHRRNNV